MNTEQRQKNPVMDMVSGYVRSDTEDYEKHTYQKLRANVNKTENIKQNKNQFKKPKEFSWAVLVACLSMEHD